MNDLAPREMQCCRGLCDGKTGEMDLARTPVDGRNGGRVIGLPDQQDTQQLLPASPSELPHPLEAAQRRRVQFVRVVDAQNDELLGGAGSVKTLKSPATALDVPLDDLV